MLYSHSLSLSLSPSPISGLVSETGSHYLAPDMDQPGLEPTESYLSAERWVYKRATTLGLLSTSQLKKKS